MIPSQNLKDSRDKKLQHVNRRKRVKQATMMDSQCAYRSYAVTSAAALRKNSCDWLNLASLGYHGFADAGDGGGAAGAVDTDTAAGAGNCDGTTAALDAQ